MKIFVRIASIFNLFLFTILLCPLSGHAQDTLPRDWHLLDLEEDGVFGISMEKAYREILDHKQSDTVIVAIIDTGIDILHEDLQAVIWHNIREKGNDEDRNGYRGDIHGWNFLGGEDGIFLKHDIMEFSRSYFQLRGYYQGKEIEEIPRKKQREYRLWTKVNKKFQDDSLAYITLKRKRLIDWLEEDFRIQKVLGKETYTYNDVKDLGYSPFGDRLRIAGGRNVHKTTNKQFIRKQQARIHTFLEEGHTRAKRNQPFSYEAYVTLSKSKRQEIIGDNYQDFNDRYYGNPGAGDIGGPGTAGKRITSYPGHQPGVGFNGARGTHVTHGTHVAGIIGAVRDNAIGIKGVADAVKIMDIRAVPYDGDEYDKDVALAIRYAVDNGAKVINMSFAKDYSPQQEWVEKAIRYAGRKDVLIVNGAGNDARNIDTVPKYPTSKYLKKNKRFPHMITVGASGPLKEGLIPRWSNYGKVMVDVFAPGVDIYSTSYYPDMKNPYRTKNGTSMATPVVSGLAATLRSYYPDLSARQVKHIIEASAIKPGHSVEKPGHSVEKPGHSVEKPQILHQYDKKEKRWYWKREREEVNMGQLCRAGGIVNAYKAVLLAESISNR